MKISVHNRTEDYDTYRAARVKSLFNPERGNEFRLEAVLPIDDDPWSLGLVVGPSGSGKSSIGRSIFGGGKMADLYGGWPSDQPIVDAIGPGEDFNTVTGSLAAVGLGDVPSWLRPFHALSNGQQFRAGLARVLCSKESEVVIDEFTSVVDRQIAKIGAMAFAKSWRRATGRRCVLLSCHYDIIEWLQPDWVFDAEKGECKKKTRFSAGRQSTYKFGKQTEVTGNMLSNIII